MEILINALPAAKEFDQKPSSDSPPAAEEGDKAVNADDTDEELASLEKEMQNVNADYLSVLAEAGRLYLHQSGCCDTLNEGLQQMSCKMSSKSPSEVCWINTTA